MSCKLICERRKIRKATRRVAWGYVAKAWLPSDGWYALPNRWLYSNSDTVPYCRGQLVQVSGYTLLHDSKLKYLCAWGDVVANEL